MKNCYLKGHQWTYLGIFRDLTIITWLVVSNIVYLPFHIWDVILPIDELIFFKMVIAPPTREFLSFLGIFDIRDLIFRLQILQDGALQL